MATPVVTYDRIQKVYFKRLKEDMVVLYKGTCMLILAAQCSKLKQGFQTLPLHRRGSND